MIFNDFYCNFFAWALIAALAYALVLKPLFTDDDADSH